MTKRNRGFRLSDEAYRQLEHLAQSHGRSQSNTIEFALDRMFQEEIEMNKKLYIAVTTTNIEVAGWRAVAYGYDRAKVLERAKEILPHPAMGMEENTEWRNLTVMTDAQLEPDKAERAGTVHHLTQGVEFVK